MVLAHRVGGSTLSHVANVFIIVKVKVNYLSCVEHLPESVVQAGSLTAFKKSQDVYLNCFCIKPDGPNDG